jgi:hypothetical protein
MKKAEYLSWLRDAEYALQTLCDRAAHVALHRLISLAERGGPLLRIDVERVGRLRDTMTLHLEAADAYLHGARLWVGWAADDGGPFTAGGYAELRRAESVEFSQWVIEGFTCAGTEYEAEPGNVLQESVEQVEKVAASLLNSPADVRAAAFGALRALQAHVAKWIDVRRAVAAEIRSPTLFARKKPTGRRPNPKLFEQCEEIGRLQEALNCTQEEAIKRYNDFHGTQLTLERVRKRKQRARNRPEKGATVGEQDRAA